MFKEKKEKEKKEKGGKNFKMSANKIILQNIRSIYKNLKEFEVLMKQQESQPLAIYLTETWLKDQSNTKCINLDGYQEIATCNRNTSKRGGVGIFVRMDLKQTIIKKFGSTSIQILPVKINRKNGKSFLLTVIYIKPNTSINEISEIFQMFFEEMTPEPEQLNIVCGDFNIDHSSKNNKFTKIKDTLSSYNLSNMSNAGCTRESAKSRTNIDVVYCSKKVETEIIKSAVTDHYTVQIVFSDYVRKAVPQKNKFYRDWTVLENHLILEKMVFKIRDKSGRLMLHFYALDCDLAFQKFQEAIIEEVDNYIPLKKSKPSRQQNWIDNSIKNIAAKKQSFFQTFLRHKTNKNKEKFNIKSGIS